MTKLQKSLVGRGVGIVLGIIGLVLVMCFMILAAIIFLVYPHILGEDMCKICLDLGDTNPREGG